MVLPTASRPPPQPSLDKLRLRTVVQKVKRVVHPLDLPVGQIFQVTGLVGGGSEDSHFERGAVEQVTDQPPQAEGVAVGRSYGDTEARRNRKRWRLGSACSGELYRPELLEVMPEMREIVLYRERNRHRLARSHGDPSFERVVRDSSDHTREVDVVEPP